MNELIGIKKLNEAYIKLISDPSVIMEISERFTFFVEGAQYSPKFKSRLWNGKISLVNKLTGNVYAGLAKEIENFCQERDYKVEYLYDNSAEDFSVFEAKEFIASLNIPFEVRDYQIKTFVDAVRYRRGFYLSPVNSGKSLIIYLLARYYNTKTLIIVPTIGLVNQMYNDFIDYGYDSEKHVHKIYSGTDKITNKLVTVSTWQSLFRFNKTFFDQFDVIVGDEADTFKAKSLIDIMTKAENTVYRFGFTGTIDQIEQNTLTLQGLFGPLKKVTTTKELQERKISADLKIKSIILKYSDDICKQVSTMKYDEEMDFIVRNESRNKFILKLALSLSGNTLLLFQFVEKHGKVLHDMIKQIDPNRKIYYISGDISAEEREHIRKQIASENNSIAIASFGTFSRGTNIKNINNLIFSSPTKSRIRNLQSIGRALRMHEGKEAATLFDISDDFTYNKKRNYTYEHFIIRLETYISEGFKYKLYNIGLN